MPGKPHDQIRVALKLLNEVWQGYSIFGIVPPAKFGFCSVNPDRNMRSDDHELAGCVTICKLFFKPFITLLVKKAMSMDVERAIVLFLGVVEHNNLNRYIRLRHKAVTGKAIFSVGLVKAVTDRIGSGIKVFHYPLLSPKRAAIRICHNLWHAAKVPYGPCIPNDPVGSRSIDYAHVKIRFPEVGRINEGISCCQDSIADVGLSKGIVHRK